LVVKFLSIIDTMLITTTLKMRLLILMDYYLKCNPGFFVYAPLPRKAFGSGGINKISFILLLGCQFNILVYFSTVLITHLF